MRTFHLSMFLGCAALAAAVVTPGDASADTRRIYAGLCFADKDDINRAREMVISPEASSEGVGNQNTSGNLLLTCPLPDDSFLPKTDVVTLEVDVHDGNNNTSGSVVSSSVCVMFEGTKGGECGVASSTSTTGTGSTVLTPALTKLGASFASDFPYISVTIPPRDGSTSRSYLRGIFVRDS